MSKTLLNRVIKLAHDEPTLRPVLVPLIRQAMNFDTQNAMDKYLKEHPGADRANHRVMKRPDAYTRHLDEGDTVRFDSEDAMKKHFKDHPDDAINLSGVRVVFGPEEYDLGAF